MKGLNIKELLELKLKALLLEIPEDELLQKTYLLYNIWVKQKELAYHLSVYSEIGNDPSLKIEGICYCDTIPSNRDESIRLLFENDLIFLVEVTDPIVLTHLIYYKLLKDITHDKALLNNI